MNLYLAVTNQKKILARKDGYEVYQYVLLSSKTVTDYKQPLAIQEEK